MKKLLLIILSSIGLFDCSTNSTETLTLAPAAFEQKLKATPDAVLIDVRTAEEVQGGYIKGAINLDYKRPEFKLLIAGMDKSKPYFIYCLSGMRSGKAADQMRDNGFTQVTTLEGGLKAWSAAGRETVVPTPTQP